MSPSTLTSAKAAGFWLRCIALILDLAILALPVFGGTFLIFHVVAGPLPARPGLATEVAKILSGSLDVLVLWLYFAGMEASKWQATPGKLALGLKVTTIDGQPIGFGRATGRTWAKWLSVLPAYLGFVLAGLTRRKQALHDMVAGTLVVRAEARTARSKLIWSGAMAVVCLGSIGGAILTVCTFGSSDVQRNRKAILDHINTRSLSDPSNRFRQVATFGFVEEFRVFSRAGDTYTLEGDVLECRGGAVKGSVKGTVRATTESGTSVYKFHLLFQGVPILSDHSELRQTRLPDLSQRNHQEEDAAKNASSRDERLEPLATIPQGAPERSVQKRNGTVTGHPPVQRKAGGRELKQAWQTDYKVFLEYIRDHGKSPAGFDGAPVEWQADFLGTKKDESGRLMAVLDITPLATSATSAVALDFYIAVSDKSRWEELPAKTRIEFAGHPNAFLRTGSTVRCGVFDVTLRRVLPPQPHPIVKAIDEKPAVKQPEFRTWTDSTGIHKTEAAFVEFKDGKVNLRKTAGEKVIIPMDRLSREDQEYVNKRQVAKAAASFTIADAGAGPFTWSGGILNQREIAVQKAPERNDVSAVVASELLAVVGDQGVILSEHVSNKGSVVKPSDHLVATVLFPGPGQTFFATLGDEIEKGRVEARIWLVPEGTTARSLSSAPKLSNTIKIKVAN